MNLQKKTHKAEYIWLYCAGLILLASLSACQLERFRHEKYSCQGSRLGIDEIIIRQAKKGKEVKIISAGTQTTGLIDFISDDQIHISTDATNFEIDRKTGSLTAKINNRYLRVACKASVFTL